MKLTKVDTGVKSPLANYRFIFEDGRPVGFGHEDRPDEFTELEWQRKVDRMTDDLWDGYGDLYQDDDGNLYGVETRFNGSDLVPCVWSRVEETQR